MSYVVYLRPKTRMAESTLDRVNSSYPGVEAEIGIVTCLGIRCRKPVRYVGESVGFVSPADMGCVNEPEWKPGYLTSGKVVARRVGVNSTVIVDYSTGYLDIGYKESEYSEVRIDHPVLVQDEFPKILPVLGEA